MVEIDWGNYMNRTNYIGYRPTWAEVNLGNLAYNFKQISKLLPPKVKIMACVKADAYGHGLAPVAKRLSRCGASYLGVASIDEGIKLREAGIKAPILILGLISEKDIDALFKYDLTATICDERLALACNKAAQKRSRVINLHIKVDTGMGRIGVLYQEAAAFIKKISRLKSIRIEGLFTHFPLADTNRAFTNRQINLFNRLISDLEKAGIRIPLVHAANSIAAADYKNSHFNMVRPGLILYGLYPCRGLKIKLKPVLSLMTRVIYLKQVPKGYGISYGHDYITKKKTTITTLPIGYGDGYPRNLSNRGPVLIRGRRFKISGRICMDQIMVDLGNFPVSLGDEAVLIGFQGKERISVEELADLSGTIPYEIVCGLGSRIPRVYI